MTYFFWVIFLNFFFRVIIFDLFFWLIFFDLFFFNLFLWTFFRLIFFYLFFFTFFQLIFTLWNQTSKTFCFIGVSIFCPDTKKHVFIKIVLKCWSAFWETSEHYIPARVPILFHLEWYFIFATFALKTFFTSPPVSDKEGAGEPKKLHCQYGYDFKIIKKILLWVIKF